MNSLFDTYFEYVKETEPPIIFHRWSLIGAISAFLGRQCWLPFGTMRIFPNQYVMLVGNPGTRKSTAIKGAKRVLAATGYATFAAERTSKEKFLLDLQGEAGEQTGEAVTNLFGNSAEHQTTREVFIVADEFNEFVGSGNVEFLSLLGALWDWDDPDTPYSQKFKASKSARIYQPTINVLSGNTHSGFAQAFPVEILGQGFMSRLVLIYSEPSGRKITIPPVPDPATLEQLVHQFYEIREKVIGEFKLSKEAYSALDTIYKTWPDLEDTRFKHYSTRRFTHLIKNCIIMAASRQSMEIQITDVISANTILTYAELHMSKAMGELGKKRNSDAATSIMSALYDAVEPMTLTDLFKKVEKDVDSLSSLTMILKDLMAADRIQITKKTDTGESGFLPKQRSIGRRNLYVDLKLLKGKEL
jgi:hypothetical protein